MSFLSELERIAARTEQHLDTLFASHLKGDDRARLGKAMHYAMFGGGKRIRPYLLIKTAGLFGQPEEAALSAAAALECVHSYSLVHDDLPAMDDDDMRRGRPTVHVAFGEATAILVGDALLTLAFEILSEPATHPDPLIRAMLVQRLAKAAGARGMVGGQALDLAAESAPFSAAEVANMQAMKTGALFSFACEAGALLGEAEAQEMRAIADYGTALGQAFQLADDLLDAEGDAARTGKAVAKDAARGKATWIGLLGVEGARERLKVLVEETKNALAPFGDRAEDLKGLAQFIAYRES
ncbi:farnesyl diphosphate synthase [Methyloligella sp. 2.7D]|uniref:polyprenyl synthetase family protein n=1 Tax=unclassified Methyloligella TaxID=2625955 RepID=UPI00157D060D|nr:farnesyl diphosphate synthase [Methyloligella sp. GL2]QKP76454.1 polyprenyl synthetase family protein [Methyloligella sp. GL2]